MKRLWIVLIAVGVVLIAAGLGLSSLMRPAVVAEDASPDEFSAERAMEHVRAIARKPHPAGSQEIERVREYITASLESFGVSYEIQERVVAIPRGSTVVASTVKNIVARIPGRTSGSAILLDAHYDTRAMTPGASDCSSCVATLLETARAIGAGDRLENDLILLFTDNEEYGAGLGAAAFVRDHPAASEVRLALNFEGLGSTGPSILFETGPESRDLVKGWRRSASLSVGQSWFQEIYALTPIGTDLNWFSDAGIPGLNFGQWAQSTVYHTALDTPESLDLRSLQQTGSYALSLVRRFGNENPGSGLSDGNAVFFGIVRGVLVSYPESWALPLSIVVAALLIATAVIGTRRGRIKMGGAAKGLAYAFLGAAVSAGLATGIWMGLVRLVGEYQAMFTFRGAVYNGLLYVLAFSALSVVVSMILTRLFCRHTEEIDLAYGTASFWWLLSIATSVVFPGFSYLFTWPALFALAAIGFLVLRQTDSDLPFTALTLTVGSAPAVMLLAPAVYVMYNFAPSAMVGAVVFFIALICGQLLPVWHVLLQRRRWVAVSASTLAFVGLLIAGLLSAGFTQDHPRPNAVAYLQDEDEKSGAWFAAGSYNDEWTSRFVGNAPEKISVGELMPIESGGDWFPVLASNAPYAGLQPPDVVVVDMGTSGDIRTVVLRVQSRRGAPVATVEVDPYEAVFTAEIGNSRIVAPESNRSLWQMTYYALPPEGVEIVLELDAATPVRFQVSDRTWEVVPAVLEMVGSQEGRGNDMMPMPNFDYGTVVAVSGEID